MDDKQKKFMVVGTALAGCAIAAPALVLALKGIISLVLALTIGSVSVAAAPLLSALLANLKLKGLKFIASKSPIEELQNDYIRREKALAKFNEEIIKGASEANLFDSKLKELAKLYPDEAEQFVAQSDAAHELIRQCQREFQATQQDLVLYDQEIQKAKAVYAMALASESLGRATGKIGGSATDKIRTDAAVNEIQKKVSQSFARLEQTVLANRGRQRQPTIANNASPLAPSKGSPLALTNSPSPAISSPAATTAGAVRKKSPLSR
ncbi:MAG TPA: hypothetical protein VFM18_00640 [Methanosarcina sp.]|nr:hypothetical protein [Methanosarcina sp.]